MSSSNAAAKLATPSTFELVCHVVHVDADVGQLRPDRLGLAHVGIDAAGDRAVVDEGVERGVGQGVDRVGADQLVDIERVAVGGVLGSGRRPERPLDVRPRAASASQRSPENFSRNSL